MKIGELARVTGTKAETIRYYGRIGLLPQPDRTRSNYRDYSAEDEHRLRFIRHARGLGFDIADIRSLIGLAEEQEADCGAVDRIASDHLTAVDVKIAEQLRSELHRMISRCRGGQISGCNIINSLGNSNQS